MPRPLNDSTYLYGFHDRGGEQNMLDAGLGGWVLVTEEVGYDRNNTSGSNYTDLVSRGLGVIVRLNAGYAVVGTLPYERAYDDFAQRCANFVRSSSGAHLWIVGNEPNHPIEWPGADWDWNLNPPQPKRPDSRGEPITPKRYAACYARVHRAIHATPGHEKDQVLVAAPAPWNPLTTYEGNANGDWVQYFRDVLSEIKRLKCPCDGITLHTYTHGTEPKLIWSEEKLSAAGFQKYHYHFRAYRDFMAVIPEEMRSLPVYITETDQGDVPWRNENTGWVRAAYSEIAGWNQVNRQKIRSLLLYRWPQVPGDRWGIAGKEGVVEDFRQACALGYRWELNLADRVKALEDRAAELDSGFRLAASLTAEAARMLRTASDLAKEIAEALRVVGQVDAIEQSIKAIENAIPPEDDEFARQIEDISSRLPASPTQTYGHRSLTDIRRVIVHHTVTKTDVTPERIAQAQVHQGRPGITYHFLVYPDGKVYQTQPQEAVTPQTLSAAANAEGIAVALVGNFMAEAPSAAHLDRAAELIAWLLRKRSLPIEAIAGRSEIDTTVGSPGATWLKAEPKYKFALMAAVKEYLDASDGCEARVLRLTRRVRDLEGQVAILQPQAEQLPGCQQRVVELTKKLEECKAIVQQCQGKVPKPAMVDVIGALPKHPTDRYGERSRKITHLAIHHTVTEKTHTVESLAKSHIVGNQWPGIGYHYVVAADGVIYRCQPDSTLSYHVGNANSYCLGICLVGCFMPTLGNTPQSPEDQLPTPQQFLSAAHLAAWLMQTYEIPLENVVGHKEVGRTECPGDFWTDGPAWKWTLHEQVKAVQRGQFAPAGQRMEHYLLLWDHGKEGWASVDWQNAQGYIAHFRPTAGFSPRDAMLARHVVIVGGDAGVSGVDEAALIAAGCQVHRLAGANEAATKALLDGLAAQNTLWPGAQPAPAKSPPPPAVSRGDETPVDAWNAPRDWLPTEGAPPDMGDRRPRIRYTIR